MILSFFKTPWRSLSLVGLLILELAHAEARPEFWDVARLVANSPADAEEFAERGVLSAGILEHAQSLAVRPSLESFESWRRLADYEFAYPELRALARDVMARLRDVPRLARHIDDFFDQVEHYEPRHPPGADHARNRALNALEALGGVPDADTCAPLLRFLGRTDDVHFTREILWVLTRQECAEAPRAILAVYRGKAHAMVRQAAAEALARAQNFDPEIVRGLEARAGDVQDLPEAKAIARALAQQCRLALTDPTVL